MAIENVNEIKEYLKQNKDNEEVVELINSYKTPLNIESVMEFCQTDKAGKGYIDSCCDRYSKKAIDTARKNAIAKYEEEVLPQKIKEATTKELTPEQKKIAELEEKIAKQEAKEAEIQRIEGNRKLLKDNELDEGLAKYINSEDDLEYFKKLFYVSKEQNLKNNSPKPEKSEGKSNKEDSFLNGLFS